MKWLLIALGAYLLLFVFWRFFFFFRNPKRNIVVDDDRIVAPADGFIFYLRHVVNDGTHPILSVKGNNIIHLDDLMHVDEPALLNCPGTLIGIFMSPFDVHYNRAPISGQIRKIDHKFPPNRFFRPGNKGMYNALSNVLWDERPFEFDCEYVVSNERASYVVRNEQFAVYVTQIAEAWVRKIVTLKPDGPIAQGEIFGLIRMGSQVDMFVPDSAGFVPAVRERQHVKAGLSTIMVRRGARESEAQSK